MRLLFLTIEFSAGTFSGNGVYSKSQVQALARLGHEVFVISGRPEGPEQPLQPAGAVRLVQIELPVWHRLDGGCSWTAFGEGVAAPAIVQAIIDFGPCAVVGVDWHAAFAYDKLGQSLRALGHTPPPFCYNNYRVYSRTPEEEQRTFMQQMERAAVQAASVSTALSSHDADYLAAHLGSASTPAPQLLLPALRSDMAALPPPPDITLPPTSPATPSASPPPPSYSHTNGVATGSTPSGPLPASRRYLTCCVRLSPEKEAHRFVEVVEQLAARGALARLGVTPLLCGAAATPYAQQLQQRLRAAAPACLIMDQFLGPSQLAEVYAATKLNVHPCLYDAYGMTVVEAASQGAPSLVNAGGSVGATDLLRAELNEVILTDLSRPNAELAQQVEELLGDEARLAAVGQAAAVRARSWTEDANAAELARLVQMALASHQ